MVDVRPSALITLDGTPFPRITNVQHSPTAPAAKQAGEQRLASTPGFRLHARFHMGVGGDHGLMAFKLFPRNISGVVVVNPDRPGRASLPVPIRFAGTAIDDLRSSARFPEDISAGIDRVGEDRQNAMINWQLPNHLALPWIARPRRQTHLFLAEPQQDLPFHGQRQFEVRQQLVDPRADGD